jgi:octopine/nopaline transport system substrate-binding protein
VFSLASDEAGAAACGDRQDQASSLRARQSACRPPSTGAAFVDKYLKGVVEVREYKTTEEHDLDLKAGRVDLVMASMAYLTTASQKPGNEDMATTGPRFQGGVSGRGSSVGLRKDDPN